MKKRRWRQKEKKKKKQLENEEKKMETERALQEKKLETERALQEMKIRLDHEANLLKIGHDAKVELEKIEAEKLKDTKQNSKHSSEVFSKLPKIPVFSPKTGDSFDSFLYRFEIHVKNYKWTEDQKFIALSNLISGDALNVLHSLGHDQQNYTTLKNALLKKYQCTALEYSKNFRQATPLESQDIDSFVTRVKMLFDAWIELDGCEAKTFDQLRDLMIREQLYRSLDDDLVVFIRERTPKNIKELISIVHTYVGAHPDKTLGKRFNVGNVAYNKGATTTSTVSGRQYNDKPPHNKNTSQRGNKINYEQARTTGYDKERRSRRDNYSDDNFRYGPRNHYRTRSYHGYDPRMAPSRYGNKHRDQRHWHNNQDYFRGQPRYEHRNNAHISAALNTNNNGLPLFPCKINNTSATCLRDTGSNVNAVAARYVNIEQHVGRYTSCTMFDGSARKFPIAKVNVSTPFITGVIEALVIENPITDLIIGNSDSVSDTELIGGNSDDSKRDTDRKTINALTRAGTQLNMQQQNNNESNQQATFNDDSINRQAYLDALNKDITLTKIKEMALTSDKFYYKNNLIYTKVQGKETLVVPMTMRHNIMKHCHDSVIGGHMGINATKKRIFQRFTWPNVNKSIKEYVQSCEVCQKKGNKLPSIPIQENEVIGTPFTKLAIDVVGPLKMTKDRNRFILTIICCASRWPEAYPLKTTTSKDVAEALFDVFSRFGVPDTILSDNAQNFVSNAMEETMALMGIQRKLSTAYHPISNGMIERLNGSLKKMLSKLANVNPDWDRLLPGVLFSYREIPHHTTGYSPFELIFGRRPRGPADILADCFSDKDDRLREYTFVTDYATDLKERLKTTNELAHEHARETLQQYRDVKNGSKTTHRVFEKGDKVLILLPKDGNNLRMTYQGPYEIMSAKGNNNYTCKIGSNLRTYHVNLMKRYFTRIVNSEQNPTTAVICAGFIEEDNTNEEMPIHCLETEQKEFYSDVEISKQLTPEQQTEANHALENFKDILTDIPGRTTHIEHNIRLTTNVPVKVKQYPIPYHAQDKIEKEIDSMIKHNIIRQSSSPYSSPMTIVQKLYSRFHVLGRTFARHTKRSLRFPQQKLHVETSEF